MPMEIKYHKQFNEYNKEDIFQKLQEIFGKENISRDEIDLLAYSKDYSPLFTHLAFEKKLVTQADFIVWPVNINQISQLLIYANEIEIPVIPFGEGSGVVGAVLPIFGGIIVDLKKMDEIIEINDLNLTATIQTGKNGMNIERELNRAGYTLGHIPQSLYTSSLGGYIAHNAAGQFSTKYGKIEDMIIGMEAVLPSGEIVNTYPSPKKSCGSQIDKLLIGSEGTLAIITQATIRIWPKPKKQILLSYTFKNIEQALNAVREILRNNLYPAVIRIYDKEETSKHFPDEKKAKNRIMVIFVCEGTLSLINAEKRMVIRKCIAYGGIACHEHPVKSWLSSRFNVSDTSIYPTIGLVYDTIEVSIMWDKALTLYSNVIKGIKRVKGTIVASAHASHFYPQGVCFYFTFAGSPIKENQFTYSESIWSAVMKITLSLGGSISHHHGIGLLRSKWMKDEWKTLFDSLKKVKLALDPKNILNPGKMYMEFKE